MEFHATPMYQRSRLPLQVLSSKSTPLSIDKSERWLARHSDTISDCLNSAGALLIRNIDMHKADDFRRLCRCIAPSLTGYVGGDSPRRRVADEVYTSTEFPSHLEIALHNELSYTDWWPDRIFFGCLQASHHGGETPLGDGRLIYQKLDPVIRGRFIDRGVKYLQHLRDENGEPGPGKSWQDTFETTNRDEVEILLGRSKTKFSWTETGLRTWTVREAVITHPVTNEPCWHNQADLWHRDLNLAAHGSGVDEQDELLDTTPQASIQHDALYPDQHATYGDDSEIELDDLLQVRAVTRACEIMFSWAAGDLLIVDNASTMHGRKPYQGARNILVAMS